MLDDHFNMERYSWNQITCGSIKIHLMNLTIGTENVVI